MTAFHSLYNTLKSGIQVSEKSLAFGFKLHGHIYGDRKTLAQAAIEAE